MSQKISWDSASVLAFDLASASLAQATNKQETHKTLLVSPLLLSINKLLLLGTTTNLTTRTDSLTMCQILGMNCASPTDFTFSLKGFCRRDGDTDKHAHGWGAAIYQGKGLRCFHDTQAACRSPVAHFMIHQSPPIRTYNMMSHIRYATVGDVALENVHPFTRELWGNAFSFCHNGECPFFSNRALPLLGKTRDVVYSPVGDTDSEAVFCALLNALRAEFSEQPSLPALYECLSSLCDEIARMDDERHPKPNQMPTIFNFLLGCGPFTMFAYSWPGARPGSKVWNGLHYIVREPPFSTAQLIDDDDNETGFIDFRTVTTPNDRVAAITTKPLTHEEGWTEVPKGRLVVFESGIPYWSSRCISQRRGCGAAATKQPSQEERYPFEYQTMVSDGEEEKELGKEEEEDELNEASMHGMELASSLESEASFLQ